MQDTEKQMHFPNSRDRSSSSGRYSKKLLKSRGSVNEMHKPTVLIVDDESEIRDVIAAPVSENSNTIQAENAEQAIAKARQKMPFLILLDIMIPGKTGIEACEQLRKDPETRHIPIIMLTAAPNVDSKIRSFIGGADDFIAKPFNADELITRIDSKIRHFSERHAKLHLPWPRGNLSISKNEPVAQFGEQRTQLTTVEHSILKILTNNTGKLVYGKGYIPTVFSVDTE